MGRFIPGIGYVEGYDEGIIPGGGYVDGQSEGVETSSAPIVLPKEFTPGFSTSKKPTVPVEIDWGSPHANNNLVYANIGGYDHVNKIVTPYYEEVDNGIVWNFGSTVLYPYNPLRSGDDFRGVLRAKMPPLDGVFRALFFIGHYNNSTDNSGIWINKSTSDKIEIVVRNNGANAVAYLSTVFTEGETLDIYWAWVEGSKGYLNVNGIAHDNDNGKGFNCRFIATPYVKMGRDNTGNEAGVEFSYVYKTLNDLDAVKELRLNPYKIFKPKIETLFLPATAGGGPIALTGSGSLSSPTTTLVGAGTVTGEFTGTGNLSITIPEMSGAGVVTGNMTATGDLSIVIPTLSGAGVVAAAGIDITGSGSLASPIPVLSGAGVTIGHITGTGDLNISIPELVGAGVVTGIKTGTGDLSITVPILAGAGTVHKTHTGTGSLTITIPDIVGSGTKPTAHTGLGTLEISIPTLSGAAVNAITQVWTVASKNDSTWSIEIKSTDNWSKVLPNRVNVIEE